MRYIVELDTKIALLTGDEKKATDGKHGVFADSKYPYRSQYPYVIAWLFNKPIELLNAASFAAISTRDEKLKTQLAHPVPGTVFEVEAIYRALTDDEISRMDAQRIKLSDLIEGSPQLYVKPKLYDKKISFRTDTEGFDYLKEIGGGNASEGARKLLEWARSNHISPEDQWATE